MNPVDLVKDRLGERTLWIQRFSAEIEDAVPKPVFVFLDGEYYVEKMGAPEQLRSLIGSGSLPPFDAVYVSHIDGARRWDDSFCNPQFAKSVSLELLAHLKRTLGQDPSGWYLVGLSLTGLAAAHVALSGAHEFDAVIAQSGSFWWNDCWLPQHVADFPERATRFRFCCGTAETDAPVDHGNGLLQRVAQLESNERMRDALIAVGFHARLVTYDGGHSLDPWSADLPGAIRDVLE